MDYRDERLVGNVKYLWEPNRHQHLVTLLQAWRLADDPIYLTAFRQQLSSWLDQCPYLKGPNWSSSLELGIRLINWSFCWRLLADSEHSARDRLGDDRLAERWMESIYRHAHFIHGHFSYFSSANNHLLGEITGLFIAGCVWPLWPQMRRWQERALTMLLREAELQNAADGVNREQSVFYHQYVLDYLLLAALIGREHGIELPNQYWERIERMLEFIASLMDVSGNLPMLGDDDGGSISHLAPRADGNPYRSLLATGALLFNRADFKHKAQVLDERTRWLLGPQSDPQWQAMCHAETENLPCRRTFPAGGYYILGCDFETEREVRLVIDAGPLGYLSLAGHGHADALAVWLSYGGHEFLIDPGTYTYHTEQLWRDYFRGTSAHNTITVDGLDQSVIGGNFMWTRHAKACCDSWRTKTDVDLFEGHHDGYTRLQDPVTHRRRVTLNKAERIITIDDYIACAAQHAVERYWHFAEHCELELDGSTVAAKHGGLSVTLTCGAPTPDTGIWHGADSPPHGWVSRRFGSKQRCPTVVWRNTVDGDTVLHTQIRLSG